MKQGQKFSRQRVVMLKKEMLRGTPDVVLARMERVSANTIRRMRLGETYGDVVVEGEESLRPPIDVHYVQDGEQIEQRTLPRAVLLKPDEELDAFEARILEHQARVLAKKAPEKLETAPEVLEKAKQFGVGEG